ncbi:Yip1 family protein [Ferrimonas pelagia]
MEHGSDATPSSPEQPHNETEAAAFPRQSWLAIMLEPRKTLRAILDSRTPMRYFWPILVLAVLSGVLSGGYSEEELPFGLFSAFALALVIPLGVLVVWALTYLFGYIFQKVGGWLGGQGEVQAIVIGMIWAQVPAVFTLVLTLLTILLYGPQVLIQPELLSQGGLLQSTALVVIGVLQGIFAIWSLVLAIANLAEAHRFSLWRSVGTHLIVIIGFCALLLLPVALLGGLAG